MMRLIGFEADSYLSQTGVDNWMVLARVEPFNEAEYY